MAAPAVFCNAPIPRGMGVGACTLDAGHGGHVHQADYGSSVFTWPVGPPKLWTSWRDRRDGRIVTVVEVRHWDRKVQTHGWGYLKIYCEERPPSDGRPRESAGMFRVDQREFEGHFELIYDPYTGWEAA
jgi:hypothetical protein